MLRGRSAMLAAALILVLAARAAPVPKGQVAPEALLDGRCAIYLRYDGYARHREAWQKTALAEVWRNALQPVCVPLGEHLGMLAQIAPLPVPFEDLQRHCWPILEQLCAEGCVFGLRLVDAQQLRLQITVVLPGQAKNEAHARALLRQLAEVFKLQITALQLRDRRIQQAKLLETSWHFSWWSEGDHLVLLLGTESPEATLDVLEGKTPSVLQNEWYKRITAGPGYPACVRGYLYGKPLVESLARLGPTAQKFIATSGLEDIPAITWHLGAEGRAIRSSVCVHLSTGQRRGLAALFPDTRSGIEAYLQGKQHLPPLSPRADVDVFQMDLLALGRGLRQTLEAMVEVFATQEESKKFLQQLDEFLQASRVEALRELLPHLGQVWLISDASAEGLLSTGMLIGVQVKDVPKARKVLAQLKRVELGPFQMEVQRRQYRGHELLCLNIQDPTGRLPTLPLVPTLAIVDDWLLLAWYPQPIQGVILRREFPHWSRWKPSPEAQKILASLALSEQRRLVAFSEADPRGTIEFLGSLVPIISGFIRAGTSGQFDTTLLPPTQALTEPLFPNVTVCLAEPDCVRIETYESLRLPSLSWGLAGFMIFRFVGWMAGG
ncbi:hypothetical protein HRbin36_00959 [bacterium HR36]|nr:hypothetical protein HRbin36_00959 [bacterium HR36]